MHFFTYKQYNSVTPLPCCFMSVQHFFVSFRFTCLILLRTTFFYFKWMCFYFLQPFCGSSKIVQFAVLGSSLSYLNELGFGFASLFYLQTILFIVIVRGSSLPLSFYEDFSFLFSVWHFYLPIKYPALLHSWGSHFVKRLSQQKWQWRMLGPGLTCAEAWLR